MRCSRRLEEASGTKALKEQMNGKRIRHVPVICAQSTHAVCLSGNGTSCISLFHAFRRDMIRYLHDPFAFLRKNISVVAPLKHLRANAHSCFCFMLLSHLSSHSSASDCSLKRATPLQL